MFYNAKQEQNLMSWLMGLILLKNIKTIFKTLPTLNGGVDVLAKAAKVLANTGDTVFTGAK